MKVCIVSFISPYAIPYINIYLSKIKELKMDCDILYWDRDGDAVDEIIEGIHYIPYSCTASQTQSKIIRYLKYIPVTMFIRGKILDNDYDKIIFLQTHAAVACKDILLKKYVKKYIVDIRDYTLEHIKMFRKAEEQVIKNSYSTVISSPGYQAFLPKYEYVIAHNYTPLKDDYKKLKNTNPEKPINISFIGYVRFYEMAKKLLQLFANDSRFHLSYIGKGANDLRLFCEDNNIKNVTLIDRFSPDETPRFYCDCDIVNNLYGNNNKYLDYALANKLYYGAQFRIPVLVSQNTYSSYTAEKYNIGITWNPDDNDSVNKLYEQYMNFDKKTMEKSSEKFLKKVVQDNFIFENTIKEFLRTHL